MSAEKVVLVTGSSSGFGYLTAETLARQGYTVFAGIRQTQTRNILPTAQLNDLAAKERLALRVVDMDISSETSIERAVSQVIERAGRLDVVINNAGMIASGPLEAYSAEQVQELFDTNVFSVIRVNRVVLPQMRKQGSGLLVQVSSIVGRQAFPFTGLYAASKFAVEALTETYRQELAALGIDAVVVEPSAYPTKVLANGLIAADGERIPPYSTFLGQVSGFMQAASQHGNPQEVADTIASLIATPAGQRPLRTVIAPEGQREGLLAINGVSEQIAGATVEALGWTSFTTFKHS